MLGRKLPRRDVTRFSFRAGKSLRLSVRPLVIGRERFISNSLVAVSQWQSGVAPCFPRGGSPSTRNSSRSSTSTGSGTSDASRSSDSGARTGILDGTFTLSTAKAAADRASIVRRTANGRLLRSAAPSHGQRLARAVRGKPGPGVHVAIELRYQQKSQPRAKLRNATRPAPDPGQTIERVPDHLSCPRSFRLEYDGSRLSAGFNGAATSQAG